MGLAHRCELPCQDIWDFEDVQAERRFEAVPAPASGPRSDVQGG
jgi:hypothetical protein